MLFANFSIGALAATTLSEVDEYLNCPVNNILNPLEWWTDNYRVYPNLSSMALDYLSIPHKYITLDSYSILTSPSNINCSRTRLFSRPAPLAFHLELAVTLSHLRLPLPWVLGMPWPCLGQRFRESHPVGVQEEAG